MADFVDIMRAIYSPFKWPLFWRRAYLVTLPITLPIHLILILLVFMLMVFFVLLAAPVICVVDLWRKRPNECGEE